MPTMTYPGATWVPSVISHPDRPQTLGIVIHWTAGHEAGDVATLTRSGKVDVQFYVTKKGKVYQFLPLESQAWHGFHTANTYLVGIETEGSGEDWTFAQFKAVARLTAWLCKRYDIPVEHVKPVNGRLPSFHGIMGHADLSAGGVDGNDHTDTVPRGTGWAQFLSAVETQFFAPVGPPKKLTLRQRIMAGFIKAKFGNKSARDATDAFFRGRKKSG